MYICIYTYKYVYIHIAVAFRVTRVDTVLKDVGVLHCVAFGCIVLQCVAAVYSGLKGNTYTTQTRGYGVGAVCCSKLKCVALCCSVLQRVAVVCRGLLGLVVHVDTLEDAGVLQCVVACCSVLHPFAECCRVLN